MVCDHCMAHALPCDENSVCEQCQLHELPCIHRWCRESPGCRDECTKPNCRYAHEDHLPCTDTALKGVAYIICPGHIPEYLSLGPQAKMEWYSDFNRSFREQKTVLQRQRDGYNAMKDQIASGEKLLKDCVVPCSHWCMD